jgi:hypothetical protein
LRSGSAFVRLALGFARVDCAEWVPGRPAAGRRARAQELGAGRSETGDPWRQDALDSGFHGVPQDPAPGSGVGCAERAPDAVKPRIHGVRTHWIRGFMAFHGSGAGIGGGPGSEARSGGGAESGGGDSGGGQGLVGGGVYGMMWEKGGVWGLGVI